MAKKAKSAPPDKPPDQPEGDLGVTFTFQNDWYAVDGAGRIWRRTDPGGWVDAGAQISPPKASQQEATSG